MKWNDVVLYLLDFIYINFCNVVWWFDVLILVLNNLVLEKCLEMNSLLMVNKWR